MKNIFVGKNDSFKVEFVVAYTKSGETVAAKNNSLLPKDADLSCGETHYVLFKNPSYKDNVDILSKSVKADMEGGVQVDPSLLRYARFLALAQEWSFKDDQGNKIKLTAENINNLSPKIANVILEQLDERLND
jgi:hypothetical protein